MADVDISYNNSVIASLSDSGTEVLETNGTFMADDIIVAYTKSGGSAVTTVSWDDHCTFVGAEIAYIDGNGVFQRTTSLANGTAVSYQMLSGSLLVWANNAPASQSTIYGAFHGMTYVGSKTISATRGSVYLQYYQVD